MMKKLLILLVALPLSVHAQSWPSALSLPLILPMLTGDQEGMDAVADSLNFNHSRQIACRLDLPVSSASPSDDDDDFAHEESTSPLTVDYQLRWGYKGAGDKTKPFNGVRGRLHIQVSYDGLSFHLCKSRKLRTKIYEKMAPLLTITPCQEFYLKMGQLIWTVSQQQMVHVEEVMASLQALVARLKLTPGGSACRLYGMPVLSTPEHKGLDFWLERAPKEFANRFIVLSQKVGVGLGLLSGAPRSPERQAYMRALLSHIDYYQDEPYCLHLPKGGTVTIPFASAGSGDPSHPFTGTMMTVEVPPSTRSAMVAHKNDNLPQITQWQIALKPEHECIARLMLLFLHNRRKPLPSYKFTEELSTLFARMSITPVHGSEESSLRALLGLACQYHQHIARHDFSTRLNRFLDPSELLLQLARVAYRTYTLSVDGHQSPQELADFATLHTADALRCYRGMQALRAECAKNSRVPYLAEKGVTLDLGLFFRTLFDTPPSPPAFTFDDE